MKNLGTRTLETDRLILRKFASSDAPGMINGWASDEKVTRYYDKGCRFERAAVSCRNEFLL